MGDLQATAIPDNEHDVYRREIRAIMKKLSGPYPPFATYHPLQDTVELYYEIWYDSSSSDD